MSFQKFSPSYKSSLMSLNIISIHKNLSEALSNEKCRKAMRVEINALEKNQTWKIVDLLKGKIQ